MKFAEGEGRDFTKGESQSKETMKIYLCSTKTDFEWEREKVWRDVLWELEEVARGSGLSIQLIDMYQGTENDPVHDRHTFDEFLREISHCHQESVGPFFLCFLGDKYGPVPLPRTIQTEDFNIILKQGFSAGKDVRLLQEWYVEDSDTGLYVLQAAPYMYRQFILSSSSKSTEGDVPIRQKWPKEYLLLQDMIYSGRTNEGDGEPQKNSHQVKYASGVEEQINIALDLNPNGCLIIRRTFQDMVMNEHETDKYIDMFRSTDSIDKESQQSIKKLYERLHSILAPDNLKSYEVPWGHTGFDPMKYHEHVQYLYSLGNHILSWITRKLKENIRSPCIYQEHTLGRLNSELSCQSMYYKQMVKHNLHGVEEVEDQLNATFKSCSLQDDHQMVIVHGSEGCGKSSLVAHWISVLRTRLGSDLEVVMRFVGLSPASTTPDKLLRSLCCELDMLLKRNLSPNSLCEKELVEYFLSCTSLFGSMANKTLVFVIDALDRLQTGVQGSEIHLWEGIASMFPSNVHLVVTFTTTPNNAHIFHSITNLISAERNIIRVPKLSQDSLRLIVKDALTQGKDGNCRYRQKTVKIINNINKKNSVVRDQTAIPHRNSKDRLGNGTDPTNMPKNGTPQDVTTRENELEGLVKAIKRSGGGPLYAKLLALESLIWCPSGDLVGSTSSLEEIINHRLSTLEFIHGEATISAVCRYLVACHYGLTEVELLDLLSCNNQVLQYIYPDQMPSILRFPVTLWILVRGALEVLVDTRVIDGKTLLAFSHPVITNVCATRYFTSTDEIKRSHRDIADLFLNTWVGNKPMVVPSRGVQIIDTGNRHVGLQPLVYNETKYNFRRLDELWYQLLHTGDVDQFKEYAFCNFEYLLAHVHAYGARSLVADFKWTWSHIVDGEIHLILICLEAALPVISQDPLQLASQLVGRLRQVKDHYPQHIDTLVQQCMEWCDSYNLPLVVPLSSWLPDPRIPLVTTLEEPAGISVICPTRNNQHIFCATLIHNINMYHIPSQRLIKTLTGHVATITCLAMTYSNKYLVSGSEDCTVRVWDIGKGKTIHVIREHAHAVSCLVLMTNDDVIITGSSDHKVRVISMATSEVLHVLSSHNGPIVSVLLNNNDTILATGSRDRKVNIWDLDDMTVLHTIEEDIPSPIISMALTCDNTFLILGCEDGSLCVKSFTTGTDIHKLEGHEGKVCSIAASSDCYHAAVGCSDGNIYLYNIRTRELLDGFSGHAHSITSACCTNNQHFVITAAQDKINVWTFYRRHTHHILTDEHTKTVTCVNLSRDGKTAITGSMDNSVRIWYWGPLPPPKKRTRILQPSQSFQEELVIDYVDPDELEQRRQSIISDAEVRSILSKTDEFPRESHYRVQWLNPIARMQVERKESTDSSKRRNSALSITSARMSPNFPTEVDVVSVYGANHPRRRSQGDARRRRSFEYHNCSQRRRRYSIEGSVLSLDHRASITDVPVALDSEYIEGRKDQRGTIGSNDNIVKLWNMDICDFSADLVGHENTVTAVALSDDEAFAVSGSKDRTVKVWSINMGCIITDYKEHNSTVTAVSVFIDNERVMSVEEEGLIKIWMAETGETRVCLTGPTALLSLSPNNEYAISGDLDNTMKIWTVNDGKVVQDIAHNEVITCVAYSTDSEYIVTGSTDMSLKVWQATTGKLTQVLVEHEDTVSCVAVTKSNHYIISGSHDCSLLIWKLETGEVAHRLLGHTDHVTVVRVTNDGTVAISGSADGSLRVWNTAYGTLITTFDLHCRVLDLYMTDRANHLVIRLEESLHVPLLCLHNSPAGEVNNTCNQNTVFSVPILPIKPQPSLNQKPQSVFPISARHRTPSSVSSIPEIIKVSPIQVPISQAVKTQEKNRESRGLKAARRSSNTHGKTGEPESKKSGICAVL